MTESLHGITGTEPADGGAIELGFEAIETLQETSRSAGWNGEYRQLEAGQLQVIVNMKQTGNASVTRERASRSLEVALSSPERALAVLVPMSNRRTSVNGYGLRGDRAVLFSPGTEMHTISPVGADIVTINIDYEAYGSCARKMLQESQLTGKEGFRALELGPRIAWLRALSLCATRGAEDVLTERDLETLLIEAVVESIGAAGQARPQGDKYHRLEKGKVLVRMADYIDANMAGHIALSDLCEVGRVSQSTLQRLCRRELGLSPYEYVQARRLDAARRQLQGRERNMPIADIAQRCGFNHMGRFAAIYRRQFGVLPSEPI